MAFKLPEFSEQYYAKIVERSEHLIGCGIWSDLQVGRLRAWVDNFSTPTERYLCACLLDSLIYRSEPQTLALAMQLFDRSLPASFRSLSDLSRPDDHWRQRLGPGPDPDVRFLPVAMEEDPPTKSGFIIGRSLKRHLSVSERWICTPNQLAHQNPKVVVIVDDFLGTGQQFREFAIKTNVLSHPGRPVFIYAPLVAHQQGIEALVRDYPDLLIAYSDYLPQSAHLFNPSSFAIQDGLNSAADAASFYLEFLNHAGIKHSKLRPFGYGNLGLTYAFNHSVPDNTLPVYWWGHTPGFNPLFNR